MLDKIMMIVSTKVLIIENFATFLRVITASMA